MVVAAVLLLVAVATILLHRYLGTRPDARELWRSTIGLGASLGTLRAVLACVGWYGVQHTGGPLQVPAYFLAMLALPEAIVFGGHRGAVPPTFYLALGSLLIVTTALMVSTVGLAVHLARRGRK